MKVFELAGPCAQAQGQGLTPIRAGKRWWRRRELAPRCSATRIHCKQLCGMDRHFIQAQRQNHHHHPPINPHPPPPPLPHPLPHPHPHPTHTHSPPSSSPPRSRDIFPVSVLRDCGLHLVLIKVKKSSRNIQVSRPLFLNCAEDMW